MATRWAVCGTGRIAHDFCTCLKSFKESEHKIVAVGASSTEKSSLFASKFGIPNAFGSYEDLAKFKDVDVVYIATIHTLHVETCLMFINAGRNVLCEKPMALSLEGCKRVISAARERRVLFVEGAWSRFSPVYDVIRQEVASNALGDVKMIQANFCVRTSTPRVHDLALGGGGLMDIGLYTVQATNMVFKGLPERITIVGSKLEKGADTNGAIILLYSGGRIASLNYSTETHRTDNFLIVRGSEGTLKVPNVFWSPTEIITPDGELRKFPFPKIPGSETFNFQNSDGLVYEAAHFRECLLQGWKESPKMSHDDSETVMEILQECLEQLDIKYQYP